PAASHFVPTKVPRVNRGTGTSTHTTTTTGSTLGSTNEVDESVGLVSESTTAASETDTSQSEQPSSATSESGDADVPKSLKPSAKSLREIRFVSDLFMPKGRPLFEAQSALHVTYAIHDALLGIMAFAEAGMLHCDISAFNILLINPAVHYRGSKGEWNESVKGSLGKLVWDSLPSQPLLETTSSATNSKTRDREREYYVTSRNRGPYAVLCDAEHAVNENRPPEKVHRDRTGTPAFISAQLLLDPPDGESPVRRTFIHDLESLMWVLVWVVAHQQPAKMNDKARNFVRKLTQYDLNALGEFKRLFIKNFADVETEISDFDNSWSKQLAPIIQEMAYYFAHFLYPTTTNTENSHHESTDPKDEYEYFSFEKKSNTAALELMLKTHNEFMSFNRWTTFIYFLNLFQTSIKTLSKTEKPVDLTHRVDINFLKTECLHNHTKACGLTL
ncbi:hypothetical protein FRC07_011769, partial [Ceratobasidium sp. 392]